MTADSELQRLLDLGLSPDGRTLELSQQSLATLPAGIGELTDLETLSLLSNRLMEIPPEIGKLRKLKVLDLRNNRLSTLPVEFGQLVHLEALNLEGNNFDDLPEWIGKLARLEGLGLRRNRLTRLTESLKSLTRLETLDLSDNLLTELPNYFPRLQGLNIAGNRLASLPADLAGLPQLRRLDLSSNPLTTLRSTVGDLGALQQLTCTRGQLTSLPAEIGRLLHLQYLDLSANEIAELPTEIGRLGRLKHLDLAGNRLSNLPPEIGLLTKLSYLNLRSNQLSRLPAELGDILTGAFGINLEGNPLPEPFPELIERGVDSLGVYVRSLRDAVAHYEAKVLLVGEGNVGKSSLLAALRGEDFMPNRPTTHGIEIHPLALRHPRVDAEMTLRTWDFGGQMVYRITHQFFFSARALYLVVWNPREGYEQNEVEGWLRRIRLRVGSHAKVIVVATHADERRAELDYPRLQLMFPGMLHGEFAVDSRTGTGIETLRQAIAKHASHLPQMGQLLSPRWIAARDTVLARAQAEPQVSYEDFAATCVREGVEKADVPTFAALLHDLGQIVYYGEDDGLRDTVVLNPEWLTKAIGYVLEDKRTREDQGVLDHTRLREIWGSSSGGRQAYPSKYHPYFLRLMEKFDVSYRLQDEAKHSLIAQLVPHQRPNLSWDTTSLVPERVRRLTMNCQLTEPAPGLIAWLTVRHHRASVGKHWRSGVFLRHPIASYESEALIELETDRRLVVEVRAPSPDLYFNVLRDSVEDLMTSRWPGLGYELFVPCPARHKDSKRCTGEFPLQTLLGFRELGTDSVTCWRCFTPHHTSRLLTGFANASSIETDLEMVKEQLHHFEVQASDLANSVRRIFKAISGEIGDCPRLFTISAEQPTGIRRLRIQERRMRLVLWCEQPGLWHPWLPATYHLGQRKDWLITIAPYLNVVLKTLHMVVPVAGSLADLALGEKQRETAAAELSLMKSLVEQFPQELAPESAAQALIEGSDPLGPAQGAALRGVRALLLRVDPGQSFGDMRPVQAPSGERLWVCPAHYREYDPGLPEL